MTVELLTEHHLKFLSLGGGCTGSSEFTLVKMPHCWKSHVVAHLFKLMDKIITIFRAENLPLFRGSLLFSIKIAETKSVRFETICLNLMSF